MSQDSTAVAVVKKYKLKELSELLRNAGECVQECPSDQAQLHAGEPVISYVSLAGVGGPGWAGKCGGYRMPTMPAPQQFAGYDGNCIAACSPVNPRGLVKTPFSVLVPASSTELIIFATTTEAYLAAVAITGIFTDASPPVSTPQAIDDFTLSAWESGGVEQMYPSWGQTSSLQTQKPTLEEVPAEEYLLRRLLDGENPIPHTVPQVNIVESNQSARVKLNNNGTVDFVVHFWAFLNYGPSRR